MGFSLGKAILKLYQNYCSLGQSIIDKIVITSGIPNQFTFDFDGEENLRAIANLNKGGMLISAHIGSWDIAGYLLNRLDTTINIVLYDGEDEAIKKIINNSDKKKINIIPIKKDLTHIFKISEAFDRNELVCMHADRFIDGNKNTVMEFLGEKAQFPLGPFLLAASFKVPVSFVFAVKESTLHYHFFASKIFNFEKTGKTEIMDNLLKEFLKEMEQKVRKYPEQWYNYFNFWK